MSQSQDQPKLNPAWEALLAKIPQEFHNQILPDLKSWEQGVQQRFQEIHTQYEEYKKFKPFIDNNVDADYAIQAVTLADELQRDPGTLISKVNEAWNLGFISKEEAEKLTAGDSTDDSSDFLGDEDELMKNPKFKAMYDTVQAIQQETEQQRIQREEEEALNEFQAELDALEEKYTKPTDGSDPLPFHRTFVTALISQGIDGDEAVKQYHQLLAMNAKPDTSTTTTDSNDSGAPVVMGNGGTQGSGTPDGSVDFGKMSTSDFNDTIEQMLAKAAESGQG